jgi:Zn-dependent M28 family amino/carboxypeptidase
LALTAQWASLTQRLTALRTNPAMVAEPLEGWTITTDIKASDTDQQTVPNAAAMVRGSDPKLRDEYVVISAHMDHVGHRCNGVTPADSVCNGADDDASGTVGVLELAKAFATAPTRPKRSVIFLIVSGEERGLWGSDAWAAKPPVPIGQIVANLNMDMVGRNWKDTVVAIGQEYSDLGRSLTQVTARHPELRMTAIGDQWPAEGTYYRSDHFHFARRGVPILFFTSGFHPDYHGVTDSPEKIDAEKEARLLKVLYYLARDVADRTARPQWEPESYRRIVEPAYQH